LEPTLRSVAFCWGIAGVLLLLIFAVYRLAPMALDLTEHKLSVVQWLALGFSIIYMAYAEGYRGFHKAFAPRVVVRAIYLKSRPEPLHIIFAPLYCMGYIHATRRRQVFSIGLTLVIICFILIARTLSQPWRGILDAGVVVGLSLGIISICYFLIIAKINPSALDISAEVPEDSVVPKSKSEGIKAS